MKKKDVILIAGILGFAVIFFVWNEGKAAMGGDYVMITVDGDEYGIYRLDEENEIDIRGNQGYNKLVIKDGAAYMQQADCPDGYCVDKGHIKRNGESIICLPHKVVVEVRTEKTEPVFDAVTQ